MSQLILKMWHNITTIMLTKLSTPVIIKSHYAECRIFLLSCWVSLCYVSLCWLSLCRVSLCWVSLCWVSPCWVSRCWVSLYRMSRRLVSYLAGRICRELLRSSLFRILLHRWFSPGSSSFAETPTSGQSKMIFHFLSIYLKLAYNGIPYQGRMVIKQILL